MKSYPAAATAAFSAAILVVMSAAPVAAEDEYGTYEQIHHSSQNFADTAAAVEARLRESALEVHAVHDVRVPDNAQQARVFVLTSPDYLAAAAGESPRTISAQILRVAVYTFGEDLQTFVNMASPRAHAMLYYANSDNYDSLVAAADKTADSIRNAISRIPGEAVSVQQEPIRTEKHYQKFKGDGPARMMTKFRRFRKSQLTISESTAESFADTVTRVSTTLAASEVGDATDEENWQLLAEIPIGDDAVYFGLTNPYLEDKMIRINSRFRSDGKSDNAPFPGVDHMPALPTEVLVIKEDDETLVLHYGQMWRMQLYFWDSGYRAFTANVGVPGTIGNSIEDALTTE